MEKQNSILTKPIFRGHSHQAAFFLFIGLTSMLLTKTKSPEMFYSVLVYAICVSLLFGISALYHRPHWGKEKRLWMKRLDHASIFACIASSGTPIFLYCLPPSEGIKVIILTWTVAILGMLQTLFWIKAPKWISALLYLIAGWLIVPYIKQIGLKLDDFSMYLMLASGIVYSVGAIIYATKKPNPYPKYFGYHEIFHLFVIIGALLNFLVINNILNAII